MNFFNSQMFNGQSLLVYSGIVENFLETVEIQKEPNSNDHAITESIRSTYRAQFRIQEKQIYAEFPKSVMIKNGDQISVCGEEKNGRFNVLTFRNHTRNISQHSSIWWVNILLGILFFLSTCYIYFYVIQSPIWIEQLFAITFSFAGLYMIFRGLLIQKAIGMLKKS